MNLPCPVSSSLVKILVIRLKQIGDALLSLPVCASLRKTFPDAQIDYLIYEHIAPLFLKHPAIDNVRVITAEERKKPWRYLGKVLSLRKQRYDMVVDLMTVPITVLTTRLSGAQIQIGFDKGKWRSRLYKTPMVHRWELGPMDCKLAMLDGLPYPVSIDRTMKIYLDSSEVETMRQQMREAGVDMQRPVLLFSPISRLGNKNWPGDYFVTLVEHCLRLCNAQAVFIWGPGERDMVQPLAARIAPRGKVFSNIATNALRDLAALSANCALFVGNDSGPRHVAEAVGIPTFTIFAPTVKKSVWLPNLGDRHRAVDMTDLLEINEEQWFEKAPEFRERIDDFFRAMTPEFVITKLDPMLEDLALVNDNRRQSSLC